MKEMTTGRMFIALKNKNIDYSIEKKLLFCYNQIVLIYNWIPFIGLILWVDTFFIFRNFINGH